jgi:hypothetical protein
MRGSNAVGDDAWFKRSCTRSTPVVWSCVVPRACRAIVIEETIFLAIIWDAGWYKLLSFSLSSYFFRFEPLACSN